MATSKIQPTIIGEKTGTYEGYTKLTDGTLIQYGVGNFNGNSGVARITFPIAFYDAYYVLTAIPNGDYRLGYGSYRTVNALDIGRYPTNQYGVPFMWVAVGRWK